jgi:MFS family permease
MLFAGRFVDKIGTKTAYVVAIGIWSTGAVMHAFAEPMGEGIAGISSALGIAVIPVSIAGFMLARAVLAIAFFHPATLSQGQNRSKKPALRFGVCTTLKFVGEDAD